MTYISRLALNPRSREVQHDLADCQSLHRTILSGFRDVPTSEAREHFAILFRLEPTRNGEVIVLVQSQARPDWSSLRPGYLLPRPASGAVVDNPAVKEVGSVYARLTSGAALAFRLLANPTKRLSTAPDDQGRRPPGRRVELQREEDQLAWLARKGKQGGFDLLAARAGRSVPDVRTVPGGKITGRRNDPHLAGLPGMLTFGAILFEGRLRVTDGDLFRTTLQRGIGSGKAYGFGLLSIAPPS